MIKRILMGLLAALGIFQLAVIAPTMVSATPKDEVCNGIALAGGDCAQNDSSLTNVLKNVVNILSLLVGFASVVMIIIGGFKYIISSGDSNSVNSAKNTIMFAVIGLVIVAFAQVIVIFVLNRAVSTPATTQKQSQVA